MTPERLKQIKHSCGLSWRALACVCDVDESTLRKAARGVHNVSGSTARMLEMLDRGELPERYL